MQLGYKACIKRYFGFFKGFKLKLAVNTLLGITNIAMSLTFVWLSKQTIDIATGSATGSLTLNAVLLATVLVLQMLSSAYMGRQSALIEIAMRNSLVRKLFVKQMHGCLLEREKYHTGDVIGRMDNDVYTISNSICSDIPTALITSLQTLAALIFLSMFNVYLALTLVLIMPVCILLSKAHLRKMRKVNGNIRNYDSLIQTHIQENLQHRTVISTLEYTDKATDTLTTMQNDLHGEIKTRQNITFYSRVFVQMGFSTGYIIAFLWGVYGIYDKTVTFGMMAAFLQLVNYIQRPILDLSRLVPSFIRTLTAIERIVELEQIPTEQETEQKRLHGAMGVRLEGVTFAYPNSQRAVVDNFSHTFEPNSTTAIVGETGAGKSTLFKLILALIEPDKGSIKLFDSTESVDASPDTRCNIIYVPQGNSLLSGTIRENLLIGNPNATDDEIRTALYTAAADFVYALPDGLETRCTEQGGGISEGQAQRIAIARGLLRDGGILLLDEPSSALDTGTEEELMQRLADHAAGKTLIMITHKREIARLCNKTIEIM